MSAALMPVTTGAVTSPMGLGSDSLPVSVELHGQRTFLADSMQFHLEMLLRLHPQGVYYIMPTFRGEASDERHLNEFFHIESEAAVDFNENLELVELLLASCVSSILEHRDSLLELVQDIRHLERFITVVDQHTLPRIRFSEAVEEFGTCPDNFATLGDNPIGLTPRGEQQLLKKFRGPVWVSHLPRLGVPFYQADGDVQSEALCADLLMGIGEVVGAGTRHRDEESTLAAMVHRQVDPSCYDWYLRLKREFPLQSSGFGIGLERLILWILGHEDIRDVQLFVRQRDFSHFA